MDKSMTYIANTQTLIGEQKRTLIDQQTGEILHVDQVFKRVYGSRQFWKIYLMDFLTVLGIIDSKQLDVFIYIAENTNSSTNIFLGTYKEIAAATGVSQPTIAKIMRKLQEANFIRKRGHGKGIWYVNPNILMKGNDNKRQMLLTWQAAETDTSDNMQDMVDVTVVRGRMQALSTYDGQQQNPGQLSITGGANDGGTDSTDR